MNLVRKSGTPATAEPVETAAPRTVEDHPAVIAARERVGAALEAHRTAVQEKAAALRSLVAAEADLAAGNAPGIDLGLAREAVRSAELRISDLASDVELAGKGVEANRARARAELLESLRPAYALAVGLLAQRLAEAAIANRAVLDLFLEASLIQSEQAVIPRLDWQELLEPAGSTGETRYHAWRAYVGQALGLDLPAPQSA